MQELTTGRQLPTIQELYKDPSKEVERDALNHYLNQSPPEKWVKTHPFIKNYKYLPIDKVEFLLRMFFKEYSIEVISYGMLLNSVSTHVRVHYKDPLTGEMKFHDGVGAKEIQTMKDTGPLKLDMSNINSGAVQMALPIAKTVAIKDATDHFGNIFGANLNRKDTVGFRVDEKLVELSLTKEEERLKKLIERANDKATLEGLKQHVTTQLETAYENKWKQLDK